MITYLIFAIIFAVVIGRAVTVLKDYLTVANLEFNDH